MDVAEILKAAGAELSPEVLAKVSEGVSAGGLADTALEVTGLKGKIAEFKVEKQEAKDATVAAQLLATEAEAAKDKALEEKLILEGDRAKLDEYYSKKQEEQNSELKETVAKLGQALSDRDLATTRSKFGHRFENDGELYLSKMVTIDEDGKATYTDTKGNIVATDEDSFNKYLDTESVGSLKHVLKGTSASGGGGNGGGGGEDTKKATVLSSIAKAMNQN